MTKNNALKIDLIFKKISKPNLISYSIHQKTKTALNSFTENV